MATYETGEHKNLLAQILLKEFKNRKADFLSVIPNVPQRAISSEGVRLNMIMNSVTAEVNRSSDYSDEDVKELKIEKGFIPWSGISTSPIGLSKDDIRDSVINKESEVRTQIMDAMEIEFRDYVLNKIAPPNNSTDGFPVLETTGDADNGRKRLTVDDLISYAKKWRALDLPGGAMIYGVLCQDHLTDLQIDTKKSQEFRDLYHNTKTGEPFPLYGFRFFHNNSYVRYDESSVRIDRGAAKSTTDKSASVFFTPRSVVSSIKGMTVQHRPANEDTRGVPPKSETNAHSYVMAEVVHKKGVGAIISG